MQEPTGKPPMGSPAAGIPAAPPLRQPPFYANEEGVNQSAPTPVVIPEVLPPTPTPTPARAPGDSPDRQRRPWFDPLAALALIVVDNLWLFPEFFLVDWPITIPLCFLSVLITVFLVQRRRAGDRRRTALLKALVLASVAAVPFSVTGTPVGLALLAWAGIRHPWRS